MLMVQLDRRRLRFDLDELDLDVLGPEHERDVRRRARGRDVVGDLDGRGDRVARDHLVVVRFELRDDGLQIRHREADVIHRAADRAAGRRLHRPEEQKHVRKLDDLEVVRADRR